MAGFILKGVADEYQSKVDLLNGCIDEMNGLKSEYHAHLGRLTDVMDETDSNFDKLLSMGEENIEALNTSIKNTENRRDAVQASLDAINEIGDTAKSFFTSGIEAAVSGVEAAAKIGAMLG